MMSGCVEPTDVELAILYGDLDACLSLAQSMDQPYLAYLIEMALVAVALELTNTRLEDAAPAALNEDARQRVRAVLSQEHIVVSLK